MFYILDNRAGHYLLLTCVSCMLLFTNLGATSLWDVDEGRNSTCSFEMLESGNWITPTCNAELRAAKPVLFYWLQMLGYSLFGINEFAARLPSALAALLTVFLTYELARFMFKPYTGLLAGFITATSIMLIAAARFANQDAILNFSTVLLFLLFWVHYAKTGKYAFILCSAASALAVLSKGPVGLALPAAVILLFLFWEGRLHILWSPRLLLGIVVFCLITLPWYILVTVETKGEFIRDFLFKHNVGRFMAPMEHHSGGSYYYPLVLILGLAPWSCFLIPTVWYSFWSAWKQTDFQRLQNWWAGSRDLEVVPSTVTTNENNFAQSENVSQYRFLCCWIGMYLLFFTLAATKLPNYVLPMTSPMAILTARFLHRWKEGLVQPPVWLMRLTVIALCLTGIVVTAALMIASGTIPVPRLNHTFPELQWWAILGIVPLVAGIIAWQNMRLQRRSRVIVTYCVCSVLFLFPIAGFLLAEFNHYKPNRDLVAEAGAFNRQEEMQIVCYRFDHLPSLNFYTQRTTTHVFAKEHALEMFQFPTKILMFMRESDWTDLQPAMTVPYRVVGRHRDLYRNDWAVVVTNQ